MVSDDVVWNLLLFLKFLIWSYYLQEPDELGWKPYVNTWLKDIKEKYKVCDWFLALWL